MFQANIIKERVMKVINQKIEALQKEYDLECKRLEKKLEADKTTLADEMVNRVTSKIL